MKLSCGFSEIRWRHGERIENRILLGCGQKGMLDNDLAALYGVETRALNQAVKRNLERFPADFMFQLSANEFENWGSQLVMSKRGAKMGCAARHSRSPNTVRTWRLPF